MKEWEIEQIIINEIKTESADGLTYETIFRLPEFLEQDIAARQKNNCGRQAMTSPNMTSTSSQDYRELAIELREIARRCRLPGARREILNLALRYERRADYFDERNLFRATRSVKQKCQKHV